jgi:hypothetical protein
MPPSDSCASECRYAARFFGTFLPSRRASESPIAIACLRLFTVLPLRPDFSLPRLNSCISRFTSSPAEGEYFRRDEDFFDADLLPVDFFAELCFALVLLRALDFFALLFFVLDFFALVDFFLAAFLVAMTILPRNQMVP